MRINNYKGKNLLHHEVFMKNVDLYIGEVTQQEAGKSYQPHRWLLAAKCCN